MSKMRSMSKQGTAQNQKKMRASDRSAAESKRNNPATLSNPESTPVFLTVSREEIADRAHALFLARGGRHGDDWADWFRAEAELGREKALRAVATMRDH